MGLTSLFSILKTKKFFAQPSGSKGSEVISNSDTSGEEDYYTESDHNLDEDYDNESYSSSSSELVEFNEQSKNMYINF